MKLAFFMPGAARSIRGGFKVLLMHASALAERGHEVTLFFPASNSENRRSGSTARLLRYLVGRVWSGLYSPRNWAPVHRSVRMRWIWRSHPRIARSFPISIMADRSVIEDVMGTGPTNERPASRMLYFFMEYEYYMAGGPAIRESIERAIQRADAVLALSPAAEDVAQRVKGARAAVHLVNPGVELDEFVYAETVGTRSRTEIGFALREEPFKRTGDVICALAALRGSGALSGYTCWAYGTIRAPRLPDWIDYSYRPSTSQLCGRLNHTAIFVVASLYEGWGLPGAEAMACGAALVSTRNGGCEAYAMHLENALLCVPGNVQDLSRCIRRLIEDPPLRLRLAEAGARSIRQFTWEASSRKFLEAVRSVSGAADQSGKPEKRPLDRDDEGQLGQAER
jgi:glycosyltransferase involved in cell wall biosynthesis